MSTPSKPLVPPGPLTFEELRLVVILSPSVDLDIHPTLMAMDVADVARVLADQVIRTDQVAANLGIDLALAIRERFDPVTGGLRLPRPRNSGGSPNDLERKRSSA